MTDICNFGDFLYLVRENFYLVFLISDIESSWSIKSLTEKNGESL